MKDPKDFTEDELFEYVLEQLDELLLEDLEEW